ncbi:MAG TPA: HepT-like ribonuclease domain-containing protein [Jiangellaceae bacterium]|nr:HepT-like ribonuclease domain-containing protein [Jiangellaceae bacterium]
MTGDDTARILDDLEQIRRSARRIVDKGAAAFLDPDDDILRRAARSVVLDFSSAVDRLGDDVKARHPDIPWRAIRGARNVVAQYRDIQDDLIWTMLSSSLPGVVERLRYDA